MSDGPYKSLPMSRAWKRLAAFGQNDNFEPTQVADAAMSAIMRDWRRNVPKSVIAAVRSSFDTAESSLFADGQALQLQAMGENSNHRSLTRLFLDCASLVMESGQVGEAGLVKAVSSALLARGARGVRQVEEHYFRKTSASLAKSVRSHLEQGVSLIDLDKCAKVLLKISPTPKRSASLKRQELDQGIELEHRR